MFLETLIINILSIILMLLATFYVYFKYKYKYFARKHIAYLEPQFPFGNTKSILFLEECFGERFRKIYNEFKKTGASLGGFYMFAQPNIILVDPELIKNVMTKDFKHFQDTGLYLDEISDPIGAHLVALKGQKWKATRAKLTPTFSSGKIKMMFGTIVEITRDLYRVIDEQILEGKALEMKDLCARLSVDVIGSCAFGLECSSLKNPEEEFRKYGQKVFDFDVRDTVINFLATNFPWILKLLKVPMTSPDVADFFLNTVRQTVEHREKNNTYRSDFLDLLIRLKNSAEGSGGMSMNELSAQVFVFFAAGFETTSSTLNFCMYELSRNLEVQQKLREEIQHFEELNYETILEMKYMDRVINETLRKYPPIPMVRRECTESYRVPNTDCVIDVGTTVVISMLGLHRDPEYFPDPEKFDPERFGDEGKAARRPFTYLPFGEGPRSCIGMRFALMETKIVLAMLLKQYKFTLDPGTILPVVFSPKSVFLSPVNPIYLKVEKL